MTARPVRSARPRSAPALRGAAPACLLLLVALTCNNVNVVTPPQAPGKPLLPSSAAVDDTCVASVYTGYDSTVCAVRLAWGDGDTTVWLPDSSSDTVIAQHVWYWGAQFLVTAQARDARGILSEWSAPCTVAVTGLPAIADSLLGSVYVGMFVERVIVAPDGQLVCAIDDYHPADTSHYMKVVSLADMVVTDSILLPAGGDVACYSGDGQFLYVAWDLTTIGAGIDKFRTSDFQVMASARLPSYAEGMSVTPDGSEVWVLDWVNDSVLIMSTSDLSRLDAAGVPMGPVTAAFDTARGRAYIASDLVAELTVMDITTRREVDNVSLEWGGVLDLALPPAGNHLYVTIAGDTCNYQSIDLARLEADFSFYCESPEFEWLAATPSGDWLYLASEDLNYIAVVRPGENRIRVCVPVVDSIQGPLCVCDMATLPDGRLLVLDETGTLRLYGPSGGAGSACIPKAIRSRSAE
jgi:DNA-binding beta-propeller fold protein YncE